MFEFLVRGIGLGLTYGLLAMPLSLLFLAVGTVDFAVGSYAVVAAAVAFTVGGIWGVAAGIACAALAASCIGLIVHVMSRRGTSDPLSVVMSSLGFAIFLQSLMQTTLGTDPFSRQVFDRFVVVHGVHVSPQFFINLGVALIGTFLLWVVLFKTPFGRCLRASAANERGATLMGLPVGLVRFVAFVGAGILSGIAGVLYLFSFGVDYAAGMDLTLAAFGAAIVLGIQSPVRGLIGGLAIGIVEAFSVAYVPSEFSALVPLMFIFGALVFGGASKSVGVRA